MFKRYFFVQFAMTKLKKEKILSELNKLKSFGYNYINPIELNSCDNEHLPFSLDELKNYVNHCSLCQKAKGRKSVLFGEGSLDAKILYLLPSPTLINDESKTNYIGKSGDILLNITTKVLSLDIKEVFTTTVLKCFMGDSEVTNHEINCCKPYLDKQIEILKPKIIVGFGIECYNYLFNERIDYNKIASQIVKYKGVNMVTTHSLNLMIRNPSLKKDVMSDMQKVKLLLEKN